MGMYTLLAAAAGCCVGLVALVSLLAMRGVRRPPAFVVSCMVGGTLNMIPSLAVIAASPFLFDAIPGPQWFLLLCSFFLSAAVSSWNCLCFFPSLVNRSTPYWDFASATVGDSGTYDVFISYKAEDARLARQLADWLIAAGRRPWFDEYVIPRVRDDELEPALESGPSRSALGIVMASAEYARSPWTRLELQSLVNKLSYADLFNLYSGDWPTSFPSEHQQLGDRLLDVSNRARYEGSLAPVLSWLRCRLNIHYGEATVGIHGDWFSLGANWQIDLGQWKHLRTILPGQLIPHLDVTLVRETAYLFEFATQERVAHLNVICGIAPEPWRRKLASGEALDKRILQKEMKSIMADHLAETTHAMQFEGAHLVYVDEDPLSPQFGFTYWDGHWIRRYSVVLPRPSGELEEIAFVFTTDGNFRDVCSLSGHMDILVTSVCRNH